MAHSNGLNDASRIDDKMLRDVEDGLAVHPVGKPVVSAPASGMGNPAPLGLLCFGMTTGVLYCYMHAHEVPVARHDHRLRCARSSAAAVPTCLPVCCQH